MSIKYDIKSLLDSYTNKQLHIVNERGGPFDYRIVEYVRTPDGIRSIQLKAGSLELLLDYAQHLLA